MSGIFQGGNQVEGTTHDPEALRRMNENAVEVAQRTRDEVDREDRLRQVALAFVGQVVTGTSVITQTHGPHTPDSLLNFAEQVYRFMIEKG